MRRIRRTKLKTDLKRFLQTYANALVAKGSTSTEARNLFKAARKAKEVRRIRAVLKRMNRGSGRCMYCEHDRGDSIDHFCPIKIDPNLTFDWNNWLLACSVCNSNNKRDRFPAGLLNPTATRYRFEVHFEFAQHTGKFKLKTVEAITSEPVFGLNHAALRESRKSFFVLCQASIILYAEEMGRGRVKDAMKQKRAVLSGPHATILATIQRWYSGRGRRLLSKACAAAIDSYPEILTW